jgi:hypothetical protein
MNISNQSVIAKINSHESLTDTEKEFIIDYVKSKPKLKIFAGSVSRIIQKYQSSSISDRVILVRQLRAYLPQEGYVGPTS